jgi:branched-subunit amino acid aminotransferase/4-amino-4-deoxychorismate lyase
MPLFDCMFVWKNGTIIPWMQATLHVSSHVSHSGTGVVESIRCYETAQGPAVFRLGAHLDRWFASARFYSMEWRYTRQDLAQAVLRVIGDNEFCNCYIRFAVPTRADCYAKQKPRRTTARQRLTAEISKTLPKPARWSVPPRAECKTLPKSRPRISTRSGQRHVRRRILPGARNGATARFG